MPLHQLLPPPGASFSSPSWSARYTSSFILWGHAFSVGPSTITHLVSLCLWIPLVTLSHSLAIFLLVLLLDYGPFEARDGTFPLVTSAFPVVPNLVLVSVYC